MKYFNIEKYNQLVQRISLLLYRNINMISGVCFACNTTWLHLLFSFPSLKVRIWTQQEGRKNLPEYKANTSSHQACRYRENILFINFELQIKSWLIILFLLVFKLYPYTFLCVWPSQIDYILCSQRWKRSIQSAKTRLGADCS